MMNAIYVIVLVEKEVADSEMSLDQSIKLLSEPAGRLPSFLVLLFIPSLLDSACLVLRLIVLLYHFVHGLVSVPPLFSVICRFLAPNMMVVCFSRLTPFGLLLYSHKCGEQRRASGAHRRASS
jgi:hypothetical protein